MLSFAEISTPCGCYDEGGYYPISPLHDLSPCFVNGILINLLSVWMIVSGGFQFCSLRHKPTINTRFPYWLAIKLSLIGIQIVLQISLTLYYPKFAEYTDENASYWKDAVWWSSFSSVIAQCIVVLLTYVQNYKSYVSLPQVILYWMGYIVFGFFRLISIYLRPSRALNIFLQISMEVVTISIFIIEVQCSLVNEKLVSEEHSLRDYANIFSRFTFSWMTPLMQKGYKQYLTLSDLPPLPSSLKTENISKILKANWENERLKNWKHPSLLMSLVKAFGRPFFLGGLYELIKDFIRFSQPQLLKNLIRFVQRYGEDKAAAPLAEGFLLVISMFGLSVLESFCLHQYIEKIMDMGIKVKSSLNTFIYQKSLVLSIEARQEMTTGDIVNLMSVDTQRLQTLCNNLQIIWSGPVQIVLCLVSLYKLMGNSMWMGLLVLLFTIPMNTVISRALKTLQHRQMKVKDERTSLISEILSNISSLKLYAWENPYRERLMEVRNDKELKNLQEIGVYQAVNQFIFNMVPSIVSTSTFAVFIIIYSGTPLSTDIVFTAISLFNLLEFPLTVLPWAISDFIEAQVSVQRLTKFFMSDELDSSSVSRLPADPKSNDPVVQVSDGTFLWSQNPEKIALTNFNYSAKLATLNCLVGRVGSGKSAVLQAILGNLNKRTGKILLKGTVAYVPQIPWIMNGTVKENIIFGFREDPAFYKKTIEACDLSRDLSIFPEGDMTQVGEKGISLSGGQKVRLALARAVYSRADIFILDDILSAVDEHVGKHIIKNVLGSTGLLKSRCRILCTNNLHVLKYADQITVLSNGNVMEEGSYESLINSGARLSSLLREFGTEKDKEHFDQEALKDKSSESSSATSLFPDEALTAREHNTTLENARLENYKDAIVKVERAKARSGRSEHTQKGSVKWEVYLSYMKACGVWNVLLFMLCIVISMGLSVLANVWLKYWSELNSREGGNPSPWKNLGIYFGICLFTAIFSLCETLVQWLLCSISGSKKMHQKMLDCVLRAPMEFFETTPIGRILNRFSNDISKIDESLFRVFANFFGSAVRVGFTILVIVLSTWQFILFVIPLGFIYRYFQMYYLSTSRELRRLDSITRSPIFAHLQETLNGAETIRAYDQSDRFVFLSCYKMNRNMSAYHPSMTANRWLSIRLEFIGSLIILGASGLLILTLNSGRVTPGLVGLSVSYALQVTQALNRVVRMSSRIESDIVSIERVEEYSSLPSEAPVIIESNRPSKEWPHNGALSFDHYSTRYRDDLDLVLKDINISINPREKIGIVGRTGAGKSSLTLAIFRIIEAVEGKIIIDDINTGEIGLYDLRSKLSIIPQDAQIFEGTIRSNLDPIDQYPDDDLWNALRLSHLADYVNVMYKSLEDKSSVHYNPLLIKLSEGGSNLSVGQRQLMCLARALCKSDSKILVLDEATANVDVQTDSIVQQTIRSAFKERTILTIAHRLNTIIDSDRIIVLDKGKVAEFDTPDNLLKDKSSLFFSLCKEGGLIKKEHNS